MDRKDAIKQTVNTVGWEIIEEMMNNEFVDLPPIKSEGKTNEEIAREAQARELMHDKAHKFLNKIRGLAGQKKKDKGRYI